MRVVPGLDRGLRILLLLAEKRVPMRVSDLARSLELPRSAAYELIHTLAVHGMIKQLETGEVALGPNLPALGHAYSAELDFEALARDTVQRVTAQCGETAQIGVLDGCKVFYIAKADSPNAVPLASTVGVRLPAQCTALGKILLAMLPQDEFERRLATTPLVRLTDKSITDTDALRRHLREARSQRFAWEECESNPNIACVAAPISNGTGATFAALSISMPLARMNAQRRHQLRALVIQAADALSAQLGNGVSPKPGTL
jgi:IclR family KDG regulon transcriptional repressor